MAHGSAWGEDVSVVVHHVPDSEEFGVGYEAVTMKGFPTVSSSPEAPPTPLRKRLTSSSPA